MFLFLLPLQLSPPHRILEHSFHDPVFWDVPKGMTQDVVVDHPSFLFGVIVGAGTLAAALSFALDSFVEAGVVLLFFPAVAHVAVEAVFAAAVVVGDGDVVLGLPVVAGDGFVGVVVGLPPVVLPVVGVDALRRVVLDEVEGAEFGFIVEHEEVFVLCVVVDECAQDFFLVVGIGTKVSVGALADLVGVVEAEILLVFLVVVVFFHEGVGVAAALSLGTLLLLLYVGTHFWGVEVAVAASVFVGVVVDAVFVVVGFGDVAGVQFEDFQVEVLGRAEGTLTMGATANL